MHDITRLDRLPATPSRVPVIGWALATLCGVAFGLMAIDFAAALNADRPGWWALLQARLTSDAYTFGTGSAHAMVPVYQRALTAMTSHTLLGGLALTCGLLQFIPALRRRWPRLHRASGILVILAVVISMAGAFSYLAATPLAEVYASPGFGLSLWALAGVALAYVALAIIAIRRRDFRSHMGFMALLMSTLLTAPVLRFEWALFGAIFPFDMAIINQGVVSFLAMTTTLMMAVWMDRIGARDLPMRARFAVFPAPLITLLAGVAGAVVVHETLLAPFGLDLIGAWRATHERWSPWALCWGLPTLGLLLRVPREIAACIAGARASGLSQSVVLLTAAGALVLAWHQPPHSVDAFGLVFFWIAFAVTQGLLVLAARRSPRADAPWSLFWLFLTLSPAVWPLLYGVAWLTGQSFTVALWLACTIGTAVMVANAFLTAFAVQLPFGPPARAR